MFSSREFPEQQSHKLAMFHLQKSLRFEISNECPSRLRYRRQRRPTRKACEPQKKSHFKPYAGTLKQPQQTYSEKVESNRGNNDESAIIFTAIPSKSQLLLPAFQLGSEKPNVILIGAVTLQSTSYCHSSPYGGVHNHSRFCTCQSRRRYPEPVPPESSDRKNKKVSISPQ